MTPHVLKRRVEARDRLLQQAQDVSMLLSEQVLGAFARGEIEEAEHAARTHDTRLRELTENLRVYQAELHAQADELAASHARTEALVHRFAALFAGMPVACMLVGFAGEVLEHNAMAARLLNLHGRSGAPRFLRRLVDTGDYQDRVRPAFHEAQASGASAMDHIGFFSEDGRRFTGDLYVSRLPAEVGGDRSGQGQYVCAVIDRTEHLQDLGALEAAAESLRQSQAFLADSARLARIGGWELTLQPRSLRWSDELRSVLDLPPGTPASLEATLACCAPHDRVTLAGAVAAAEQGRAFEIEIDMVSAAGRPMRVLAVGHAEGDAQGDAQGGADSVRRVSGVLQDITPQHLVRQQLGDLTERLDIANEAGGIGVWDWDLSRGRLVFDQRMGQMVGIAPLDAHLHDLLAPQLLPQAAQALQVALHAAVQHLQPLNLELQRITDDGSERWLHLIGRPHADTHGHAVRLIGCAWDSSPEHEALHMLAAKEAAESASRAKSAFLSRMSHELRTPLNAILGFSQLMRMEADAGETTYKPHRVTLIESAARHLLDLVNEVLDVSRIESGSLELRLAPVDLARVVAESLPMVQEAADRRRITLVDDVGNGPACWVLGDRLRLKEVLINLLSNAVKYNVPAGQVVVTAHAAHDRVHLCVRDTGQGLDADQMRGLFQPFNRLGAESSGIEGSGMGLFVSRRFIELMGGSIEVQSECGSGTAVHVRLPRAPA